MTGRLLEATWVLSGFFVDGLAFLTLRMAPQAQWEIRQYANAVGEIVAATFPRTWELFLNQRKEPKPCDSN